MSLSDADHDEKRRTGTTRRATGERILAVFAYPALPFLAAALDEAFLATSKDAAAGRKPRGRRAGYPTGALLAVACAAKAAGSRAQALSELGSNDAALWERCRTEYLAMNGEVLPAQPPTKDDMDYFYARFTRDKEAGWAALQAIKCAFVTSSVRMARYLGNLLPGDVPDWATYDPRHTVFGDGTILGTNTDVRVRELADGSTLVLNSRATDGRPRIQDAVRCFADKKGQAGVNFISLQTRADAGRIVLAVTSTLASELWAALDLADQVAAEAGDGFHTLVYDRLITGWAVRYLMGKHGVQVQGKNVAPAVKKSAAEPFDEDDTRISADDIPSATERSRRLQLPERIQALAAAQGVDIDTLTTPVLRHAVLKDLFDEHRLPPVGTTLYPTTKGYDVVYGYCFTLVAEHVNATGTKCTHDLVVDDGALYTYAFDPESTELVKTHLLRCTSATRYTTAKNTYGVKQTYQVPCDGGSFTYTRTWEPEATRFAPSDKRPRAADPIGWRLHPIPRADVEQFTAITRDRNDSEAYQAWFQRSLPTLRRERAATLYHVTQELDFLFGAILANAETWANRP